MGFDDIYNNLLQEALRTYTIFEYVEDDVITENPDDFYNIPRSNSFLIYQKYYAADIGEETRLTHGDLLIELEALYVNGDDTDISQEIKIGGEVPPSFIEYLQDGYEGKYHTDRDTFLNELDYSILGRINKNEKIISFWNPPESFNQNNVDMVISLISDVYKGDPSKYRYELAQSGDIDYYDSELYEYEEFIDLNPTPETPVRKSDTSKIIHNLDPAIKGQVMKLQGVKPKKGFGAEYRFAMGESSLFTESINDSGKLKCIVLAGSPYSGKSYVNKLIQSYIPGIRTVNTDKYFERHGDIQKAKLNTVNQTSLHVNSLLPLIIDTTSGHPERLMFRLGALYQLGYDVSFCLVTAPWEDLENRFNSRERKVEMSVVKNMYDKIYTVDDAGNVGMNPTYASVVGRFFSHENFFQYDNSSKANPRQNNNTLRRIEKFFNSPVKNAEGQKIIHDLQQSKKKYLTDTDRFDPQEIKNIISLWYRK
jgi:predicted kinase